MVFQAKRFRPSNSFGSTLSERLGAKYRANLSKHPFLLFGLPFISVIIAGSFVLTPATAMRYERFDRKVQQVSQEEAMGLGLKGPEGDDGVQIKRNPRRRILGSEKEEYYKLMAKDLDNWEQKRVKRFKGEPDGRL
ncbi:cytochrome c oxidase assembly protein COX16, mitochondrial [Paracoccidioides brasiliensis Pb03]|uniref:Cytochrome c oxidase assembly protein COX16, mitochondrial n=2 Tax=Paracoccidioides brasiliensis TaxID=121759 RepID=COX16_PARBD|nr:cytochrome c oxidase assembly protein COX16, mitochondrial [Paracoccidioides brasiliensis Pb18]Q52ZA1.1 RecName: Full=Cytochrome c oxidase assembly protein COX16, mitochondrial; Flags: Precursor [Paracoccidioides brasiliensis Pb18]AAX40578.1 putative cytochrome c oxidase assembly factor [Paracoccidioides brasiliensis]EEH19650.1 cytochrome c oxidase assembly protein COX16, mitochondrial [Paracoccidioides brasiliensis Pb03]EEH44005.1 cytochrome c oxidase assembly protein COX16, mitochondrial [